MNSEEQDPDKKGITTWNDNLHRIKPYFAGFTTKEVGRNYAYVKMGDAYFCQERRKEDITPEPFFKCRRI